MNRQERRSLDQLKSSYKKAYKKYITGGKTSVLSGVCSRAMGYLVISLQRMGLSDKEQVDVLKKLRNEVDGEV